MPGSTYHVFTSRSTDGGVTWDASQDLGETPSMQGPRLLANGTTCYLAYPTDSHFVMYTSGDDGISWSQTGAAIVMAPNRRMFNLDIDRGTGRLFFIYEGSGYTINCRTSDDDGGTNRGAVWVLFLHVDTTGPDPEVTVKWHQKISDTEGEFPGTLDDQDEFGCSAIRVR